MGASAHAASHLQNMLHDRRPARSNACSHSHLTKLSTASSQQHITRGQTRPSNMVTDVCNVCALSQVRGPPAKAAFGADGSPTKALQGFCKKAGVDPSSVVVEADAKGVEYVWGPVSDAGRSAAEVGAGQGYACAFLRVKCVSAPVSGAGRSAAEVGAGQGCVWVRGMNV